MIEMGLPTGGSEDIGDDFLGVGLDTCVADVFGTGGADFIGGDAIFGRVDEGVEAVPEAVEGIGFEAALEDGVLDAESVVFAVFGNAGEAFGIGDIVGDEGEHLSGAAAVA